MGTDGIDGGNEASHRHMVSFSQSPIEGEDFDRKMDQIKQFQNLYNTGGNDVQKYIDESAVLVQQNAKMINMQSQISLQNKFDSKVEQLEGKRNQSEREEAGKQSENFSVYKKKEQFSG